ncbi:MAG: hypothetical protein M1821_008800 [Bathelium mastoideum]|nr:MAG: hypothetical protein M1821_008800 [Bathelium mastoideum]
MRRQSRFWKGTESWQTTFSAIVSQRLRERAHDANTPVVTLFVQNVPRDDSRFLLDCLNAIYEQLLQFKRSATRDSPHDWDQNLETGQHVEQRVQASLAVLYPLLETFERVFLILDDLDACGLSASQLLEEQLYFLQSKNVKIMITSRISLYKAALFSPSCDICDQDAPVFWTCELCRQGAHYVQICIDCKEKRGRRSHLVEPYAHIELNIGDFGDSLQELIWWELQKEHGNLGLRLESNMEWPPLSTLGKSLSSDHEAAAATSGEISNRAQGNLTMAKLRLEGLLEARNIGYLFATKDRLPPNIVAFFDNLVAQIVTSSKPEDVLGLEALKIISRTAGVTGIEMGQFKKQLQKSIPHEQSAHGLAFMRALFAARGVLNLGITDREGALAVKAYHSDFHIYLSEAYNETVAE